MKRIGTLYLITVLLLLIACDPAITLRQIDPPNGTSAQIQIRVKTQHPLIGRTWYVPQITIVNTSDSPICVTSVELATKRGKYVNNPRHGVSYPLDIEPGKPETIGAWFDLSDDVRKTFFRQPTQLLVHYNSRGREETTSVSVIGGNLDTNSP